MESLVFIYAAVPRIACKGKCQGSCGPIMATDREREHFESTSRKKFPDAVQIMRNAINNGDPIECPYLNPLGQCDVYQFRPLVCRLWGVVPEMPCPYGCTPERMLSSAEGKRLMKAAE